MSYNPLIFGKNLTERIVSLEAKDETVELFIQELDGKIVSKFEKNVYWILTNQNINGTYVRLEGNLYYKWAKTFRTRKEFFQAKQFLKKRNVDYYSVGDAKEAIMLREGYTYFKGLAPKDVSLFSFDIESTGLTHDDTSKILCISTTYRDSFGVEKKRLFAYDEFDSQGAMLEEFCRYVRALNPTILLGHNILGFDLPYVRYIADKENVSLDLGRDDSPLEFEKWESKFRKDGSQDLHYHKVKCYGREIVDTLFLSIKFDVAKREFETYGLKQIIKQLKLEKEDRVFYDAAKIRDNYQIPEEWEKIKAYCMDDADDPIKLFDRMAPPFFYATQSIPKSFQAVIESATGSQINGMMVRSYLQDKHSIPKGDEKEHYPGGISLGIPGIYDNVFKVDVASLYPSIMIQYCIEDKQKDPKGHFQQIVQTFTNERLKNKKLYAETGDKYYDGMQEAQKIIINSMYGFLGAPGLNFNSGKNAALVTEYGREILMKAVIWATGHNLIHAVKKVKKDGSKTYHWVIGDTVAEGQGFKLVNADTDSISFCKHNGEEFTKDELKEVLVSLNGNYPARIKWEDDSLYEKVIVIAAKNYVLKKHPWYCKKPGDNLPKFKGASLKATTKEVKLQKFIKEIVKEIGIGRYNYLEVYNRYVKEIMDIKDITEWCSKKTVTSKVLEGERTNETKVQDVIEDTEYREGDRIWTYFKNDNSLGLREDFDGDYNKDALLKKLYTTMEIFDTIIDISQFPNYALKKNKPLLQELLK